MTDTISILIIEDDMLIAEMLKYNLEDLGFSISGVANTFEQALTLIDTLHPDLTLLDINLNSAIPANNGLALARQLNTAQLPFIFLTAYSDRDTILQAARQRPGGYLIKPVNPAALFAAIQTTIENKSAIPTPPATSSESPLQPDFFFVKVGNRNVKLYWRNVYCLEASKNYVQIRVIDVPVTYTVRGTLSFVRQQLVPAAIQSVFQQFNRSTIVNINHVTRFDAEAVYCQQSRISNTRFSLRELTSLFSDAA
jgi:DNA-binding LytR/AlgR family response regulator